MEPLNGPLSKFQLYALHSARPEWNLQGYFACNMIGLRLLIDHGLMEERHLPTDHEGHHFEVHQFRVTAAGVAYRKGFQEVMTI